MNFNKEHNEQEVNQSNYTLHVEEVDKATSLCWWTFMGFPCIYPLGLVTQDHNNTYQAKKLKCMQSILIFMDDELVLWDENFECDFRWKEKLIVVYKAHFKF